MYIMHMNVCTFEELFDVSERLKEKKIMSYRSEVRVKHGGAFSEFVETLKADLTFFPHWPTWSVDHIIWPLVYFSHLATKKSKYLLIYYTKIQNMKLSTHRMSK